VRVRSLLPSGEVESLSRIRVRGYDPSLGRNPSPQPSQRRGSALPTLQSCDHNLGISNAARHDRLGADGRQHRRRLNEARTTPPSFTTRIRSGRSARGDGAARLRPRWKISSASSRSANRLGNAAGRKITEATIDALSKLMQPGDVIIDGGNTFWQTTSPWQGVKERGINTLTSAPRRRLGYRRGYCIDDRRRQGSGRSPDPIFAALAPGAGDYRAHRRPRGTRCQDRARLYSCGPVGAGHFVKMVHNGIEYGLMQAYAKALIFLKNANIDALPAEHRFDLDIADIAEVWRRGSVIPSWLLDLTPPRSRRTPRLRAIRIRGRLGRSRWTVNAPSMKPSPPKF